VNDVREIIIGPPAYAQVTPQIVKVCHQDGSKAPCSREYVRHYLGAYYQNVHEVMEALLKGVPVRTTFYTFELGS
jgi:hypothetical protein